MRFRVVLLLVLALVLKGWVGEAMAGQMVAQQLQHAAIGADADAQPCHPHAPAGDGGGHVSCEQCQACSLNALPAAPVVLATALPQPMQARAAVHFASAEPRQGHKPPVL